MLDGTLILCSNDAGGAEIISSWVNINKYENYYYVASGPAELIFKYKLDHKRRLSLADSSLKGDWLLTGTSLSCNLELDAINIFKSKGIKTVSFLDHWINYKERFLRNNIMTLPDEVWVGDSKSFEIASEFVASQPIPQIVSVG